MVDGTLYFVPYSMVSIKFAFDTGTGFNVIRRRSLLLGCKYVFKMYETPLMLNYANGKHPVLNKMFWLAVRFGVTP